MKRRKSFDNPNNPDDPGKVSKQKKSDKTWFLKPEHEAKDKLIVAHHKLVPDLSEFLSTIKLNIDRRSSLDQHQHDQYNQLLKRYQEYTKLTNAFEENRHATHLSRRELDELIVQDEKLTSLVNDIVEEVKKLPSDGDSPASSNQPVSSNFLDNYVLFSDKATMVKAYYMFDTFNEELNQLYTGFQQFLQETERNSDPSFSPEQMATFNSLIERDRSYRKKLEAFNSDYINHEQIDGINNKLGEFYNFFDQLDQKRRSTANHAFDSIQQQQNQISRLSSELVKNDQQQIDHCYQFVECFQTYSDNIKAFNQAQHWAYLDSERQNLLQRQDKTIKDFRNANEKKLEADHAFYSIRKECDQLCTCYQDFLQETERNSDPSFSPEQMATFNSLIERDHSYRKKLEAFDSDHSSYINHEQIDGMDNKLKEFHNFFDQLDQKRRSAANHAFDSIQQQQNQIITSYPEVIQSILPNIESISPLSLQQIQHCHQLFSSIVRYQANRKTFDTAKHSEYLAPDKRASLESARNEIDEHIRTIMHYAQDLGFVSAGDL